MSKRQCPNKLGFPHTHSFNPVYLNSYLASLNAREGIRGKIHEPMSIHLSKISGGQSDRYDLEKSAPTLTALEREKVKFLPVFGFLFDACPAGQPI